MVGVLRRGEGVGEEGRRRLLICEMWQQLRAVTMQVQLYHPTSGMLPTCHQYGHVKLWPHSY